MKSVKTDDFQVENYCVFTLSADERFFVGASEIWHVAISWEDGRDEPPVEVENRRGIGGGSRVGYWPMAIELG